MSPKIQASLPIKINAPRQKPKTEESMVPVSFGVRLVTLLAVTLPLAGLVLAGCLLWGYGFNWVELGLLGGMYFFTALGVTVGYHRLFTHRSFETNRAVQVVLVALGSMAFQGPLLTWVAVHRRHHQHSDSDRDPHSPHAYGSGAWAIFKGFWHAHIGWLFRANPANLESYVKDLRRRPWIRRASELFPFWAALGLLIPAVLGWLLIGGWYGALLGFLWGGVIRIFVGHHLTWSVNSVCHLWGMQPFKGHDESRNNFVFGVLGLGEGFHNNHHAFPTSARHGLFWWQLDISYLVIRGLALLGLAWNIRLPRQAALASG